MFEKLRQMWSLVTSIGKGDKSCDLIDSTERGNFQRYDADLFELILYTLSVTTLEPISRHNLFSSVYRLL